VLAFGRVIEAALRSWATHSRRSCPPAPTAGGPATAPPETTAPLVNMDFGQTPVIASSAAATLPVTL